MAKTHPEVRLNRRPFSGIFEVVRVAADGKTITDRWPLSAEDQAWLTKKRKKTRTPEEREAAYWRGPGCEEDDRG